jgi:hypothetical protein
VRAAYDALTQIVTFSEFVDGDWIVISSGAIAAPFIDDNSNPAQIGGWSSGINPFNGKIYSSTVTKGPTPYPYVLLDGVSGTYVSTPDSAANSVTGDLTLIAWAALDDWTPTSHVAIATKWRSAGDERSFMLRMAPDGKMQFNTTSDGSMATNLSSLSTVTTGFTDGTGHWVRLSLDISAGTVNFFTSDQPSDTPISSLSWVQLGGANVVHAQTAIFDGTATTQVGAYDNTVSRLSGKVARAVVIKSTDPTAAASVDFYPQPYLQGDTNFTSVTGELWTLQGNAIATSPIDDGVKVDCDAGDYVSGSTFVSSTSGETWTLNGNASVFQPPVDASGPFGYLAEGARTNILLQSNDLSTTWSNTSNSVDVQNYAIAPDGSSTGQRIIDSSVGGTGSVRMHQAIGSLSTTTQYVYSAFFKADQLGFVKMAASSFTIATPIAFFDLTNGLVGTGSNTDSAAIESVGNGWYRCWISFTTDASDIAGDINIYVADSVSNATVDLDGTSSILVWGAQLEAGSFPSSYIATAAAAVTRNADVLSSSLNEVYPLTVYVETVQSVDQSAGTSQSNIFSVNENTVHSQDEFFIRTKQSTVDYQGAVYSGSTVVVNITGGAPAVGVLRTLTMAVALNDVEVYVDGVSVGSDTSAALPAAPTLMNIGMTVYGGYQAYGTVRNVKLFDERLTDAEVADL